MDISKYKGIYLQEARTHLAEIESGLLSLEKDPSQKDVLDALFRHYHSIKGMSASMGYTPVTRLAHAEEDLLDKLRSGKLALNSGMTTALLKCLDALRELTDRVERDEPLDMEITPLLDALTASVEAGSPPSAPTAAQQRAAAAVAGGPLPRTEALRLSEVMKVEGSVFDDLLATVGDLFMALSSFKALSHSSRSIEFKEDVHALGKSISTIHRSILSARMLPLEDLMAGLPRVVRDLTADSGKEVSLASEGMDISLDRAILEGLASPLVHIIRNAVDHGIEGSQERVECGKLSVGAIKIRAYTRKDRAVIEISDDGRGINREKLRKKAIDKGISEERLSSMPDREFLKLVCLPGLSTAEKVTGTSGRGVGMDVVKDSVEALGGALEIESAEGKGTRIIMELPRTTSITKALIVSIGPEQFLLPISKIERVIETGRDGVNGGVFSFEGTQVPVVPLAGLFGIAEREKESATLILVEAGQALGAGGRLAALKVDDFGDEIDAYVKPLLPPISKLWGATGLTIMGDGRPVFLLDVQQIISKAIGS
ncbi:MAG TPA: ATP-binding protein [Thermodesulfobacteriota bacterium]